MYQPCVLLFSVLLALPLLLLRFCLQLLVSVRRFYSPWAGVFPIFSPRYVHTIILAVVMAVFD